MSNELKVALAVLLSAAAIYSGVRFLSGQPLFGAGYDVVAVFDDAQGLTKGAIVRLNGVRVGEVSSVELSPSAREVYVGLSIDDGVEIPRGSVLQTSGLSALGEVNVEISPPLGAGAGRPLASGDTLIAATTPDIFDLIAGESTSITARADTALIGAVNTFTSLNRLLDNTGDDFTAVLAQLRFLTQATTQTLLQERDRIDRTLGSVEAAAANAGAVSDRVGQRIEGVAANADGIAAAVGDDLLATTGTLRILAETNADSLSLAVSQLNGTMRRVDESLVALNALTANLDTTLQAVNSPDGSLGLLLNDPSLYYNANAAVSSLQQLLQDLQNDPGRYLGELDLVRVF